MSRRRGRSTGGERFVSRLREALSRFSDGVHSLGTPADAAALAAARARLGELFSSTLEPVYELADGMWLFDDIVRVRPLAELTVVERDKRRLLECGQAEGDRLLIDETGRVYVEDDDGDRVRAGATLEEELLARVARESLLIDAEGEWREVFGDDGDLLPAVRRKRNEAARRRAPDAACWLVEAAEMVLELDGDEAAAEALAAEAIALDPEAPAPRELLGILRLARGELNGGAAELAAAADRSGPARRAERAAAAAEAAARAGLESERARLGAMAVTAEPGIVNRLSGEAEGALAAGRLDDADRLAALAKAVAGDTAALPARLRVRGQLRPVR